MSIDRKRTVPEPTVERAIERVEAGRPPPADALDEGWEDLELALESPLGLAETQQKVADSIRGGEVPLDVDAPGQRSSESGMLRDIRDRYAVGDFTGALVVAETLLDQKPEDPSARRYADRCREVLTQMFAARVGPLDQIPRLAIPADQITWLSLDHRAGFLLSLIDGKSSLEVILDISGMSRLDALRILHTLLHQNVIALK